PDSVDATKDDSFISPKAPRGNSQSTVQCAPSSRTYLVVTPTYLIASSSVVQVLTACYSAVASHILQDGDGVIEGGAFSWQGNNGITLSTMNTNNHQNTWGVIGAAIIALQDFMQENGYGGATFSIWDGPNMVGRGWLGWE
ncbi:hypothetical protein MMC08_008160, partial [Hypocenomyce scalaris]|nr:hypothetical protein [Hypocenomyce scalaris]